MPSLLPLYARTRTRTTHTHTHVLRGRGIAGYATPQSPTHAGSYCGGAVRLRRSAGVQYCAGCGVTRPDDPRVPTRECCGPDSPPAAHPRLNVAMLYVVML